MKMYPVMDFHSENMMGKLRGISTGEFRPPKQGEWYISGAIPEVYHAKNNLLTPFHIARLVKVEQITTEKIVEYL